MPTRIVQRLQHRPRQNRGKPIRRCSIKGTNAVDASDASFNGGFRDTDYAIIGLERGIRAKMVLSQKIMPVAKHPIGSRGPSCATNG